MATIPSQPRVRRWILLFFAVPLLAVLGIYGYLLYTRLSHRPPPERLISSKPFATARVGGTTASLFTQGNQLRPSGNDLFVEFRDAKGNLTNVGSVTFELSLNMPAVVMHSLGKVYPTSTPGRYRTSVQPQMGGDWTARLALRNAQGEAATNFSLTVK
ncbi:MAG TPA: hypothetical protein VHB20_08395 [Verrucomicrobiae bacterium]|jgi:hypothetical protein|nr:hypothetical protein [Verrucomicrobiae bacterium]